MFYALMTPHRMLLTGFVGIILAGAFLLSLPMASVSGDTQPYIDALFTATSAISTTGLTVVDVGGFHSLFGQIVILVLIQIGGLGYMIFVVMVVLQLGVRLSLGGKLILEESLSSPPYEEVSRFSKAVIFITFTFEFIGAAVLSVYWMSEFPVKHAIYLGIFHSVSAFCTAGFSLFPDNLSAYRDSIAINVTTNLLCIGGSVGFFVIYDVYNFFLGKTGEGETPKKLMVHTKLVLIMLPILIITGALLIYISQYNTPASSFKGRILTSAFQAVSASTTTGFNTLNTGAVKTLGLSVMIILMYIGASPGGTGGGVKTTTFGLVIASIVSVISVKDDLVLFNRHISPRTKDRAFAICAISMMLIALDVLILSLTENASFLELAFETVSAFGTVGLSTGITSSLSTAGKTALIITMLIGRVGPLAIGFSIRGKCKLAPVKYPEGGILVG